MNAARILVAGDDLGVRKAACASLRDAGFTSVEQTDDATTSVVQTDDATTTTAGGGSWELLILVGPDLPTACAAARETPGLANLPIIAVLPRSADAKQAEALLAAGADEAVLGSGTALELRVRSQLRSKAYHDSARAAQRADEVVNSMLETIASGDEPTEVLREVLSQSLEILGFERASVVVASEDESEAHVVSATDDRTLSKFAVDLATYPEIAEAMRTDDVVVIDNVAEHPSLKDRAQQLADWGVRRSALFPIHWRGQRCGVVFYRSAQMARPPSEQQERFGRIVARVVAHHLNGGSMLEGLREQTQKVSLKRYEAERRLRAIERLRDYFDAASDGIVALDSDGRLLFVNRAAEAITGFARDGLLGQPITDLIPADQRDGLRGVLARVLAGANLEAFDLQLATTSGDAIRVSVATSTVLSENEAALLTFRDVTAERKLESELRQTKEFLERLIDSTVDAIVASDMRGSVILFNPGAERIYGRSAADVIGRLKVSRLYAKGVARQIMRMLRSASYGGVGRLEPTRREVLSADHGLVPVNMTASIIYEDEREVATVGIFSDLRDRIGIEQRLLQAQEKLQLTEKQAMLAELAGAAAHELNQPLTSVMGYAELLCKKMGQDGPHSRAMQTILAESARMAEIVKKIGRITHYETKSYVGSAQILDLDRSADATGPGDPGSGKSETGEKST